MIFRILHEVFKALHKVFSTHFPLDFSLSMSILLIQSLLLSQNQPQ